MIYKIWLEDNKASEKIIESAVKIVKCKLMKEYITFVADRLCYALIGKQIYNVINILQVNMFVLSEILNVVYHIDFICYFSCSVIYTTIYI